jgi:parallel beta-helix repeat protein
MATFFVNEGESIQDAIDAASAGDTIIVGAGTYNESILIDEDVTVLSFDGAGATIINGQGTNNIVDAAVKITAAGATFGDSDHGFTVNAGGSEVSAVYVTTTGDNVHVEGNVLNGSAAATASGLHHGLLTDGGVANLLIENNTFGGTADQLIYVNGQASVLNPSTSVDLINNNFTGTASVGAVLESTGGDVTGNTFGGNISGAGISTLVPGTPGNNIASNNFTGFVGQFDIVTADQTFDLNSNPTAENLSASDPFTPGSVNFFGNSNNNVIRGSNNFDDDLTGRGGNDTLLGRDGEDTANYNASLSVGNIASIGTDTDPFTGGVQAGWQVNATGAGEGTDLLNDVEIVDGAEAGRILLVGNGGFDTVQDAVDAANNGDTILLAGGVTFTETVTVNKDVTITSSGTDAFIVGGLHVVSDGVTIDNVTIRNGALITGEVAGVFVQANNVTITNSVFDGNNTAASRGILTATGVITGLTISNNEFEGWATGAYLNPSTTASITGNNFHDNTVGLSVDDWEGTTVGSNTFTNNTFEHIGAGVFDANENLSAQILASNTFSGTAPEVSVYPLGGTQSITGTLHDDVVNAAANDLTFNGLAGDDTINGGTGDDILEGGAGDDEIDGGDEATGGDTARYNGNRTDYLITVNGSVFTIQDLRAGSPDGTDQVQDVELFQFADGTLTPGQLSPTTSGPDVIVGTPGPDVFDGMGGPDDIRGEGGDDQLSGGEGEDTLVGGDGNDTIDGGTENDRLDGGNGDDQLAGDDGNDIIVGGAGNDAINGGEGNDNMRGGDGNDQIAGGNGDDRADGNAGDDTLIGQDGADDLRGDAGDDFIFGGNGADILFGGADADTFEFRATSESPTLAGADRIQDFNLADGDVIRVATIDANAATTSNEAFDFIGTAGFTAAGQIRYFHSGGETRILLNTDTDTSAEAWIVVRGIHTVTDDWFVL